MHNLTSQTRAKWSALSQQVTTRALPIVSPLLTGHNSSSGRASVSRAGGRRLKNTHVTLKWFKKEPNATLLGSEHNKTCDGFSYLTHF